MKLSIIIPVYNEINSLPVILKKIFNATHKIEKKIIIVDDFSNDGTREWLIKRKKKRNIKIVFKKK
ncbi:MAG: glycosyltransferase, partial [Pirellulaceae bacterium]|nr:glycosyltransferase [Pirellulaceae bacterium]